MTFDLFEHPIYLDTPQRVTHSAWTQHVPFGMLLVDLTRPHTLVELGAHTGMSYCAFCQAVDTLHLEARCYAVDTWEGDEQAGFYGEDILSDLRTHHDPRYGGFSTLIRATFDDAVGRFDDHSIDLLHIDGFHTYEAAKHDFDTWLPRMSERGVVVLHDIAERAETFGVWQLWDELIATYPAHLEFQHGHGLGVVAVGSTVPEELSALMRQPAAVWLPARETLQRLGEQIEASYDLDQAHQTLVRERDAHEQALARAADERAAESARLEQARAQTADALDEMQKRLNATEWQLASLEKSRSVRMIKLTRASRELLREQGPAELARRVLGWSRGQRGYAQRKAQQERVQREDQEQLALAQREEQQEWERQAREALERERQEREQREREEREALERAAAPASKPPRPAAREYKQILFLSGRTGGAMRYRCDHQAESLRLAGCAAESADVDDVDLADVLPRFRAFVLHRVAMTEPVGAFIAQARAQGKPVIFETDDLVFLPDMARHLAALELMSTDERASYLEEMASIRETLLACDAATVSTAALSEWVKPLREPVAVAPNLVNMEMVERSNRALAERAKRAKTASPPDAPVVIAYFSGSPTHDRDFMEAQDAVLWALERYPEVEFLLVGPLTLDAQFDRFGARVRREPFRPWPELPALYADVSINLAPLERDNPFTESKSCVKYLEAGLVGVPTIASPRRDFVRVIEPGVNGLLADSPEEWQAALRQLIESADARHAMGERARADVRARHTTRAQALATSAIYRDLCRTVTGAHAPRPLRITWVLDATERVGSAFQATCALADALASRGYLTHLYETQPPALCAAPKGAADADDAGDVGDADGERSSAALHDALVYAAAQLPTADATIATNAATAALVAEHHESRFKVAFAQDVGALAEDAPQRSYTAPLRVIATDDELARCIAAVAGIAPAHAPLGPDGEVDAATIDQFEAALRATCW
jgi:hypothetical protein